MYCSTGRLRGSTAGARHTLERSIAVVLALLSSVHVTLSAGATPCIAERRLLVYPAWGLVSHSEVSDDQRHKTTALERVATYARSRRKKRAPSQKWSQRFALSSGQAETISTSHCWRRSTTHQRGPNRGS